MLWEPKVRHALIDGDIVAYRCSAAVDKENGPQEAAYGATKKFLLDLREDLQLDDCTVFLSRPGNDLRRAQDRLYKANRKGMEKPRHLLATKAYLRKTWEAVFSLHGDEADDALGIHQTEETLLCTIDKDLDQIPGWHYNWMHGKIYYLSEDKAARFVWYQMLIGDTADNIKGLHRVGPIKTAEWLDGVPTAELPQEVYNIYKEHERTDLEFDINYKLLKIRQSTNWQENWQDLEGIERW